MRASSNREGRISPLRNVLAGLPYSESQNRPSGLLLATLPNSYRAYNICNAILSRKTAHMPQKTQLTGMTPQHTSPIPHLIEHIPHKTKTYHNTTTTYQSNTTSKWYVLCFPECRAILSLIIACVFEPCHQVADLFPAYDAAGKSRLKWARMSQNSANCERTRS